MDEGMYHFRYSFTAGLLLQVLVMMAGVHAGEEDCIGLAGQAPIRCYECMSMTNDDYCGDPFNETHPGITDILCKEYCVKWTRTTLSGKTLIQRTCSNKLTIHLRKTSVCIEESRPSEGKLCFCEKDYCNDATHLQSEYKLFLFILAWMFVFLKNR